MPGSIQVKVNTRSWPYGTRKTVTVISSLALPSKQILLVCKDDSNEGWMLMLRLPHVAEKAARGDRGVITFKPGGMNGGYWDYEPRPEDLFA
jgi:hypothetical protein